MNKTYFRMVLIGVVLTVLGVVTDDNAITGAAIAVNLCSIVTLLRWRFKR